MEAYIGYANYTFHANKENSNYNEKLSLDLAKVWNELQPMSIRRTRNRFVKTFTILSIEVCSASRGCTPKSKYKNNKQQKHLNFLTVYKNSTSEIKTNKANNKNKYVLLNIKGVVKIGDIYENIAIRVPKSGVIGLKIGLSSQKEIIVKDPQADYNIDYLGYELEKIVHDIIPVTLQSPRKLSGLSIHGWNLHNPSRGHRPDTRLKNFVQSMRLMDRHIPTHFLDIQDRDGKMIPRLNFKPNAEGVTVGITNWLMVDFTGVKSISHVRDLSIVFYNAYRRIKNDIEWNIAYDGPVPKSRRKKAITQIQKNKNTNNTKITLPKWNSKKKKILNSDGKVFSCMRLSKKNVSALAAQLQVNPAGFKESVCKRIMDKLKNNK